MSGGDKCGALNIVRAQIQIGPRILSKFPILVLFCDSEQCGESVSVSELSPGYKSYKSWEGETENHTAATTHIPNEPDIVFISSLPVTGHPSIQISALWLVDYFP